VLKKSGKNTKCLMGFLRLLAETQRKNESKLPLRWLKAEAAERCKNQYLGFGNGPLYPPTKPT
jgi:hypothetical protein